MPRTKSSAKRLRQSQERRVRNRAAKSEIKTQIKRVIAAVSASKLDEAQTELRTAAKKLDRAASAGVIHRNKAARLKSRANAKVKAAAKGKSA